MLIASHCLRQIALPLLLLALLSACGPVHRVLRPTETDLQPIRSIGVIIPQEDQATVIYERAKATMGPAVMFGLIGASVASASNATMDNNKAKMVRPLLEDFSCRTVLFDAFQRALAASGRYTEVRLLDAAPAATAVDAPDAVVTLTIDNWGLRLKQQDQDVLSGFVEVKAGLRRAHGGKLFWDEHGTFLSGGAHVLTDYQANGSLLKAELMDAIERAGGELASQLAYPTGGSK